MRVLTIPESLTQKYEWMTRILSSYNGTEQRIAHRSIPRQTFMVDHLADSDETIQSWKYLFVTSLLSTATSLPLWAEAEGITATAAGAVATGDYAFMDDTLAVGSMLFMHPDGETYETKTILSKTATEITITTTFANTYPSGSVVVPLESVYVDNNSGYNPGIVNTAKISINAVAIINQVITGEGSAALATYNSKPLLDKVYQPGGDETFNKRVERLDFGHKIAQDYEQVYANVISGRSYTSRGREDRQWWKLFLETVKGSQKSFYTSTHRHDMTVTTQPGASGTDFQVGDDATVAGGWENITSHTHMAFEMADGTTLYKQMDVGAATFDNGDGTHTVGVLSAFPAAPTANHTIVKVSFLELVRLASDTVEIEHFHDHRVVKLSIRTIIE